MEKQFCPKHPAQELAVKKRVTSKGKNLYYVVCPLCVEARKGGAPAAAASPLPGPSPAPPGEKKNAEDKWYNRQLF